MAGGNNTTFERSVQGNSIKRLNELSGSLIRCRSADSVGHVAGDPDAYGSIRGRHVEIEFKQGRGVPTKIQWYRLRLWARTGASCAVVYTIEQALAFQQEVLASRGEGRILVFGAAAEQVRQGKHGGGPEVPITTLDLGTDNQTVLGA